MIFLRSRPSPAVRAARRPARVRAHERRARVGRPEIRHRRAATMPAFPDRTSAGSCGRCSCRSASANGGNLFPRQPGRVLPFRAASGSVRARRRPPCATGSRNKPFGQRIDRLDQRQLGEPGLIDDAVGMHHLQHAVVERRRAGHVAARADRAGAFRDSPCAR